MTNEPNIISYDICNNVTEKLKKDHPSNKITVHYTVEKVLYSLSLKKKREENKWILTSGFFASL